MPGSTIISCPKGGVNGKRLISLVPADRFWLLNNANACTTVEERRFSAAGSGQNRHQLRTSLKSSVLGGAALSALR